MKCRYFQVTLISASNLLDVRHVGLMKVYAKVSINGNWDSEWTSPVDKEREKNPRWNCKIKYSLPEKAIKQKSGSDNLVIKLYCKRSFLEDKYVGEVHLSLKKLFDGGLACKNKNYLVYRNDVIGQTFGTLKLSYRFGSRSIHVDDNLGKPNERIFTTEILIGKLDFFNEICGGVTSDSCEVACGILGNIPGIEHGSVGSFF
ncbi:hypothetical protein ACH5RR_034852 [Cinchona calisaya]|uniref:C2 domain-containing protein n=1 Tax=Cinchona calisaya TaxID=153742 RepID=A0ABD2YC52_9GENT